MGTCVSGGGAAWGPQAHRPPLAGTAGVMVSLSRILTKLLLPDEHASTLIFFLVSAGLELLCFLLHLLVRRSRFVLYHTVRPRDSRPGHTAGYCVHHDVAAGDVHFVSPHRCSGKGPGTAFPRSQLSSPRVAPSGCGLGLLPTGLPSFLDQDFIPL